MGSFSIKSYQKGLGWSSSFPCYWLIDWKQWWNRILEELLVSTRILWTWYPSICKVITSGSSWERDISHKSYDMTINPNVSYPLYLWDRLDVFLTLKQLLMATSLHTSLCLTGSCVVDDVYHRGNTISTPSFIFCSLSVDWGDCTDQFSTYCCNSPYHTNSSK